MPAIATAKGVRMPDRKVGVVAALVRGRTVQDAIVILEHTPKRAAKVLIKVINSAKANADFNHNYKPQTLTISEISVTPGPSLKRFKPAARGRALPYLKRSSHIRVVVDGEKREIKSKVKQVAEAKEDKKE
ncbi:MAG TPA: 50S ribosomal protein L22 [Candidatus Saccharimonadales bacterium]|nr:50S ribosomal protein L22 [Candidatus Saccharimonadales bacterium]